MARAKSQTLTPLEMEIMKILWKAPGATVEAVQRELEAAGRPLALPSIRTMLAILQNKDYLRREAEGRTFHYHPTVSGEEARGSILKEVVDRAFDGSALGLVAALLDRKLVSKKELRQVKDLLARHEEGKRK